MHYKETDCDNVNWILLAQDRVQWQVIVNMLISLQMTNI